MVENATDLMVCGDRARNRIYVSPSSLEILGFAPEELLGHHAYDLVHPDDLDRVRVTFGRVGAERPCEDAVFRMRRKDDSYVWIEARYRHIAQTGGLLAMLRDISTQKQAEERLAEANRALAAANEALRAMAHQDGLTGIANRRRFDELIDEEWRRARREARPLALVLLDVDHFKSYNDTHGHLAGDDCLRRVCHTIAASVRRPGDHAARYGGEEIAALLPATETDGAAAIAASVVDAVASRAIPHPTSPFGRVTVSAGVCAMRPGDRRATVPDLIQGADLALYRAKLDGRNRVRVGAPTTPPRRAVRPQPLVAAPAG